MKGNKKTDDQLYKEAMRAMDELVEEVFKRCEEFADENDYEKTWVLERFREKFNRKRREYE